MLTRDLFAVANLVHICDHWKYDRVQSVYLHSLITVQPPRGTRFSSVVTLSRPPTSYSLKITNRSFRYASPHLCNQLPVSLRQPCTRHPADDVTLSNSHPTRSPLSPSITHSLFHSRLKPHLFHKSFLPYSSSTHLDCLLG